MVGSDQNLISVIVPVYNVEDYLEECINSILSQTYTNLEILIVDDGSTDNSLAILQQFSQRDSRITIFTKENGGLSSARNCAIDEAKGEYFTFIDSDDYIEENYIEYLMKSLIDNEADISIVNSYHMINGKRKDIINNDGSVSIFSRREVLEKMYSKKNDFIGILQSAQGKLYKKELFNNIKYPLGKKYEDAFTTYKLYLNSKKIVYTNLALYAYRIREGSILRSGYSLSNLDVLEMFEERINILESNGYDTKTDRYYFCNKLLKERVLLSIHSFNVNKNRELIEKYKIIKNDIWDLLTRKEKVKLTLLEIIARYAPKFIQKRLF